MRLDRSPFARKRPAYSAKHDGSEAELLIYDEIGFFGIQAKQFVEDLKDIGADRLNVRINSPGGNVFDGITIFNALRRFKGDVVTHIDGLAASAASYIALAGDEVRMAENAHMMIHDPWSIVIGSAEDMRKEAEILDKISGSLALVYAEKTGIPQQEIGEMMAAETWLTAEEAEDKGFVDVVEDALDIEASFDLSVYHNVPDGLQDNAPTMRDLERALRGSGLGQKEARRILSEGFGNTGREADPDPTRDVKVNPEVLAAHRRLLDALRP